MERRIVELGAGDVDLVEGLWKEMVEHHRELTGHTYPVRDADEAWRRRRGQYAEWLGSGEGHLFLVPGEGAEGAPLAYAFLRIDSSGPTWNLGDGVGDLESLSVAAAARGQGIGTALLEHCRNRLRELGAHWWAVTVLDANGGAIDLYEREGFRPFWHSMLAPVE
ncbi:MAG TPA: GNAT family N-acetyltransferase [Solirubrobacterales bacterium]|nr:GNAT family N-acetyltransferase [Solirubrobacterales bacterium]